MWEVVFMDSAELRNTFSTRIRKLREERGLNQGQFADCVGISRGAMSYYEQEARTPDIGVLYAISEKCGVSADYLIGLIPDRDKTVSDVCLETGLHPKAAKRLQILQKLKEVDIDNFNTLVEQLGDDALNMTPFTSATPIMNLLLTSDEGLNMLNLIGAIIVGAEFVTGGDEKPYFKLLTNHKNLEVTFPFENITAALWVNVQREAAKLKDKLNESNADKPEIRALGL
jgi:transcriptional regulator with XRE-family HTH domain